AARRVFPHGIIGVSARSVEEALAAEANGATYLGVGSVYPTNTKADTKLIGEEGLRSILGRVSIPVYAIGGIKLEHLRKLKAYGVKGVAVVSAILGDADPREAAKRFVSEWMG
ncbi:thiamine phosphate synthase, partial [Candidatus Marsarchaeota G2 archaeon BE_D]